MRPDFAILNEREKDGFTVLEIDTAKATYQGTKWRTLSDFGKKKFENIAVIMRFKERLKFIYV